MHTDVRTGRAVKVERCRIERAFGSAGRFGPLGAWGGLDSVTRAFEAFKTRMRDREMQFNMGTQRFRMVRGDGSVVERFSVGTGH